MTKEAKLTGTKYKLEGKGAVVISVDEAVNGEFEGFWAAYRRKAEDNTFEFINLIDGVPVSAEPHNKAVAIFKEYYDNASRCDRSYPHIPSPYSPTSTYEMPTWKFMRKYHHDKIRALLKIRTHKLSRLALPDHERKLAAQEGLRQHEAGLEPCDCWSCREYRKERK